MRCKRIDVGKCGRSKIKIRILEIKTDGKFYKSVKFCRSAESKVSKRDTKQRAAAANYHQIPFR